MISSRRPSRGAITRSCGPTTTPSSAARADALQRSDLNARAQSRLADFQEDLELAERNGWNSLSLQLGRLRPMILSGKTEQGEQVMATLFVRGMRAGILHEDPVLSRLADTPTYRALIQRIGDAVDVAREALVGIPAG